MNRVRRQRGTSKTVPTWRRGPDAGREGCLRGVACTEEGFGSSSFRGGTALGKKGVLALALATRTIERNSHGSYGRRDGDA